MNFVGLLGRTIRDVELKYTQSGSAVASFSLAVDRGFKDKDGNKQTDFIDCVAWKGTAENLSKFVKKGDMIAVTGSIQTRTWEDKEGHKRKTTEILVDRFYFTGSKKSDNAPVASSPSYSSFASPPDSDFEPISDDMDESELPF
jgi:single-strand DNA-binding protein